MSTIEAIKKVFTNDIWDLPNSWKWVQIQEISEVVGGGTPRTTISSYFGGDISWITPADMSHHRGIYISKGVRSLTKDGYENSGATNMPPGTVLFSSRAPIGYVAIASNEITTNQGFKSFVPENGIDSKYLYYWLTSAKPFAEKLASGTTFLEISGQKAGLIPIPTAPEKEQTRIVEKLEELLSDLDNGVAELKKAKTKLGLYRQSLLKNAVEGQLTQQWREENRDTIADTGQQLLERILKERRQRWEEQKLAEFAEKEKTPPKNWQSKYPEPVEPDTSSLPELPEGWVWASLDMLGDIVSGVTKGTKRKTPVSTREVPYLRVANVQRGYLDLSEIKTIQATETDIEKYLLQKGDVLFNEGGDRDKLGRGWVWYGQVEDCIHQNHVFRMRPFLTEILPELVSHHGNTFGKLWFQKAGKQTTNLASINKGILQSFPVPLAPFEEQQAILALLSEKLEDLNKQQEATEITLAKAAAQRKNILKDAFSGKLVPQNPDDEPASVLLEKIKAERAEKARQPKPKPPRKQKAKVITMETLLDVLKSEKGYIDAQEAFRRCGVTDGTDTDTIERLYAELRKLYKTEQVDIKRVGDFDQIKLKDLS
ncbi:restriction endonuclease subunit S [Endozoicomonas ascidiicola]|uniref:restriction endonuclease subunit S n=1 Tax=Endozoicomonas ascidiicola TaxID=1698521 RepID=UPI0008308BFD|nr:restriction endonuclease subunit S [Endozoicomonas ascidiicola]